MDLSTLFGAITQTEQQLVPVFIHNPQTQKIAGIIFLGEQLAFGLLQQLHPTIAAGMANAAGIAQAEHQAQAMNPLAGAD